MSCNWPRSHAAVLLAQKASLSPLLGVAHARRRFLAHVLKRRREQQRQWQGQQPAAYQALGHDSRCCQGRRCGPCDESLPCRVGLHLGPAWRKQRLWKPTRPRPRKRRRCSTPSCQMARLCLRRKSMQSTSLALCLGAPTMAGSPCANKGAVPSTNHSLRKPLIECSTCAAMRSNL